MKNEPIALLAAIAIIVNSVLAAFGIVIDTGLIETLLVDGLFLVTAVLQRSQASPAPAHARTLQLPGGPRR